MLQTCLHSERLADQNAEETPAPFANYSVGMLDMERRWLLLGLRMLFGWGLARGASYEEVGLITTQGFGSPNIRPCPCGRTLAARPVLTLCLRGWVVSCGLSGVPCPLSSSTPKGSRLRQFACCCCNVCMYVCVRV